MGLMAELKNPTINSPDDSTIPEHIVKTLPTIYTSSNISSEPNCEVIWYTAVSRSANNELIVLTKAVIASMTVLATDVT
jgi:hypothetical protein